MNGRELAKEIGSSLNTFSFDKSGFCEEMMREHRTIQQSFMRLIRDYIDYVAEQPDYQFDGRNKASRDFAKKVAEATKDNRLPMI